jgi:hypothetical protein
MGLPGAGKSTTAEALSVLVPGSVVFPEPAQDQWPPAVTERHEFGCFGAITWFRSMRVPLLHRANKLRLSGGVAIVDSYYDKLIMDYADHPDMKWLLPPEDAYLPVIREMARLDQMLLPVVDCLIFLQVTFEQWRYLLSTRQREMDSEEAFLNSFSTQAAFLGAAQAFASRTGAPLIKYDQHLGGPNATASKLLDLLEQNGLLSRGQ